MERSQRIDRMTKQKKIDFSQLRIGAKLRVVGYQQSPSFSFDYRRKLLAMGLTPNTEFTLRRIAPLGDPIEISVRNTSLVVRKQEVGLLALELIG